jgi:hypothetical protein
VNSFIVIGTAILAGLAGYYLGEQARWTLALAFLGANYAYVIIKVMR